MFSHSAPVPSTSFPRKRESSGVAHEAMKLSCFLPAPGFRVKPGMTIVRATAWQKKNASLFNVVHYRIPSLLRERK